METFAPSRGIKDHRAGSDEGGSSEHSSSRTDSEPDSGNPADREGKHTGLVAVPRTDVRLGLSSGTVRRVPNDEKRAADAQSEIWRAARSGQPLSAGDVAATHHMSEEWAYFRIGLVARVEVQRAVDAGQPFEPEALAEKYGMSEVAGWGQHQIDFAAEMAALATDQAGTPYLDSDLATRYGMPVE